MFSILFQIYLLSEHGQSQPAKLLLLARPSYHAAGGLVRRSRSAAAHQQGGSDHFCPILSHLGIKSLLLLVMLSMASMSQAWTAMAAQ